MSAKRREISRFTFRWNPFSWKPWKTRLHRRNVPLCENLRAAGIQNFVIAPADCPAIIAGALSNGRALSMLIENYIINRKAIDDTG
jgi:hypothetical protein